MKMRGEARLLQTWMQKSKGRDREPPKGGDAAHNLDHPEHAPPGSGEVEQLNMKVPKGTKLRLKRLGLEQGGLSMLTIFKRMLDEYETRHREKQKD